jgi:hypothetical protein
MIDEQQPYNEVADQVGLHSQTQHGNLIASQNKQLQYQMEEGEKNLAEAQLDCEETLTKINHLLKQDVLRVNDQGILEWCEITDSKKRVLTDEGVDKIMQVMQTYINKETLLSNFDDKTIARRMLEFSLSFSALIFLKYEIFFRSPSLTECRDILKERIDKKVEEKEMTAQIFHKEFNWEKVEKEILINLEERMDYEIQKIKQEQTKSNLREFEMIFTQLKALVEATHNRAWKGEERGSLRRHFNISEVIGGRNPMPEKRGGIFRWGRN